MRLNRWKHWLFIVGLVLSGTPESVAQYDLSPLSPLDRLPIWYPIYRPVSTGPPVDFSLQPNAYTNFDQLHQNVKAGQSVEALSIDGYVWKQGGYASLRQLPAVRVLNLNGLTTQQIDSLCLLIQDWPVLERLTMYVDLSAIDRADPVRLVTLPLSLQRLKKLQDIRINGTAIQWQESINTLAGLKPLRHLELNNWESTTARPIDLRQLHQLAELRISGQNWVIQPAGFSGLDQLRELALQNVNVDTTTFQHVLNGLPTLETLSLQTTRSLRKLVLGQLKSLRKIQLTNNPDLVVDETTFSGLSNLEALVLQGSQPFDMRCLCSLTHVRTLIVVGIGKPMSIPDCIGQLNQLTELRLEGMLPDRLPGAIGTLHRLKKLSIARCGIDSLPPAICQLPALEELLLDGNKLRQLPNLGKMSALRQLIISANQLTALPNDIGQLTQLTALTAGGNKLKQLPSSLSRLVSLRTLSLQANQLERLPDALGKLRKLQFLGLNNNQLTELPASMGQLDSLQKLFIGNNRLKSLPNSLAQLKNLTELYITTNELTSLPANIGGLKQLSNLTIQSNPITELPSSICELQNLQSLTIMGTQIRLLPEQIGALSKLRHVTLTNNELIALPASIGQWINLTSLSLEQNKLEGLPNTIGRLSKLTNLRMGGKDKGLEGTTGGIQQLPDSLVHCTQLWDLTIDRQPQLDADDVFTKAARMKRLTHLKVTNCNISKLPAIDWKNTGWQMLVLSQNLLTELPIGLLDVPALQTVAVSNNRLPEVLNHDFHDKESLRVAFIEAGFVPVESLSKPNRKVASAYMQLSAQKARQHDWAGVLNDLGKAIDYAPDTIRSYAYGQRASFHVFRKEYAEALADFDKAIQYAPQLRKEKMVDTAAFKRTLATYWQQKAFVLGITGQYDAALSAITQAESFLPPADTYSPLSGLVYTERGRYLAMKNKLADADSSYRKAIRAYEKLMHPDPGIRLTIVELSLLTAQYDRAKRAIADLPTEQMRDGYATLKEYLDICLAVLKNEQTGAQAMERLTAYLDKHPVKIYGWSFDLFDNWLTKSKLPTEKMTALRQLTDATKERLVKPE